MGNFSVSQNPDFSSLLQVQVSSQSVIQLPCLQYWSLAMLIRLEYKGLHKDCLNHLSETAVVFLWSLPLALFLVSSHYNHVKPYPKYDSEIATLSWIVQVATSIVNDTLSTQHFLSDRFHSAVDAVTRAGWKQAFQLCPLWVSRTFHELLYWAGAR